LRVAAPLATRAVPKRVSRNNIQGKFERVAVVPNQNPAAVVMTIRKLISGFVSFQYSNNTQEVVM
jgi:hypothetical protein